MLVRDLWGPGMRKKYPIEKGSLLIWTVAVPLSPVFVLGMGCVRVVERCQARFCGDALEEKEEREEREERERIEREGVELREREGGDEGEASGSGSGSGSESRDEESVGLMTAMKSEQV
jgi:hypothetical protein